MSLLLSRFVFLIIVCFFVGCHRSEYPKETYPVSGLIQTSDGTPASDVRVTLHSSKVLSDGDPFRPSGMSGDDGRFQLSTYETKDGAPEGEYMITFRWTEKRKTPLDPIPKDKLQNRFALPTDKSLTCKIIQADSQDLGTFEIDKSKLTIERTLP